MGDGGGDTRRGTAHSSPESESSASSDNESNSAAERCGALRRMTPSYVIGRPIWGVRPDESAKATVTVSMIESTKVRSRDWACDGCVDGVELSLSMDDASMAWSFRRWNSRRAA